jgi:hypothetical protein
VRGPPSPGLHAPHPGDRATDLNGSLTAELERHNARDVGIAPGAKNRNEQIAPCPTFDARLIAPPCGTLGIG